MATTTSDFAASAHARAIDAAVPGGNARSVFARRLHVILFVALIVVSAVPVLILGSWVDRSALHKEIDAVTEKHLLIAQNLSSALSRYVVDVKAGFTYAASDMTEHANDDELKTMLESLSFRYLFIVDARNRVVDRLNVATDRTDLPEIDDAGLASFREQARAADGATIITDLVRLDDVPAFVLLRQLDAGRLAVGVLGLDYIRSAQRAIEFGERGHSMIVDAQGVVVAHPNGEWERISKNASKLSVVQKMMRGETGVATFYSPPMQADMIAGHTTVPETGWGVMVPQPMSELVDRAGNTQNVAIGMIAVGILVASIIGWCLARFLAQPVVAVERAARAVAAGRLRTQVEPLPAYAPIEMHSLAVSFDRMVDELRHRDDGLRVAMNDAEAANRAKTEFLANMSHELRTPLNGVLGFSEIIRDQTFGPIAESRYVDYANDIHFAGQHLLAVINDVLDVSKIEAGELKPELSDVDLGRIADGCVAVMRNRARQGKIAVAVDVPADLPPLRADERMIRQILLNLLSNAVKFTSPGGTVTVTAGRRIDGGLTIGVGDTGIGIAPEHIDLVVQPFSQVDSSLQRSYEGTGLGLYLTKTLAELHDAKLNIVSQIDVGTKVEIRFPASALRQAA